MGRLFVLFFLFFHAFVRMSRHTGVYTTPKHQLGVMIMEEQKEITSNNIKTAGNTSPEPSGQATAEGVSSTNGADDMLCLMGQNAHTCVLGKWMKCMRKPAVTMQYTLEKRHIPDMDGDPSGQTPVKGANADAVSVTGGCTIRYFDLAAGMMLLLLAGCVLKGLCRVRKWM